MGEMPIWWETMLAVFLPLKAELLPFLFNYRKTAPQSALPHIHGN